MVKLKTFLHKVNINWGDMGQGIPNLHDPYIQYCIIEAKMAQRAFVIFPHDNKLIV